MTHQTESTKHFAQSCHRFRMSLAKNQERRFWPVFHATFAGHTSNSCRSMGHRMCCRVLPDFCLLPPPAPPPPPLGSIRVCLGSKRTGTTSGSTGCMAPPGHSLGRATTTCWRRPCARSAVLSPSWATTRRPPGAPSMDLCVSACGTKRGTPSTGWLPPSQCSPALGADLGRQKRPPSKSFPHPGRTHARNAGGW